MPRQDRRKEREQWASDLLSTYCARKDVWLTSAAEIAQWLNGQGFVTFHANTLVSARQVSRWAKDRRMPARAGAGSKRGVQTSVLLLIAWLCSGQRCVSTPRRDQPRQAVRQARAGG